MNMIKRLKSKNTIIYIISLTLIVLLIPQNSYANRVTHPQQTISVVCEDNCRDKDRTLSVRNVSGSLNFTVQSKSFEMQRSDNGRNLVQNAEVRLGSTIRLTTDRAKPSKGSWFFSGGVYDSPDMNGQWYAYEIIKNKKKKKFEFKGDTPPNNNPSSIRGSGAVSCNGDICTANRVGDATITIKFPNSTAQFKSREFRDNNTKDKVELKYGSAEFTYNFKVYNPNSPPVVASCGASNVSYNNGRIIWNYTDPDGDAQRKAYIQVSTASNFTNPVVNTVRNDNRTTLDINGLIPGTRYYFQVKVNDGKVDSAWRNCGSFDTPRNNPPDLNKLSCSATSGATDYERARLTWNYTGIDEPGDQLVLKARYKRNPEDADWTALNLSNNSTGARNINDLISGFTYQVQISLNDNRNSHLGDRWKGCGTVTPPNYPVPQVTYSISKFGNPSTAKTNDQTLVLKTGDSVNANWSINNGTQVGLQSCVLSTTGGTSLPSSVPGQPGEQAFRNSLTGIGFSRNINNNKVPTIREDRTYNVNLNCTGKPAKIVRNVNQKINLKVESWPILISCIIDGNSTLQEGQTSINIKATVGNVNSYRWKIGKFGTDANPTIGGPSTNLNLSQTLDYKGVPFGRYIPWVEVARADNSSRTDKKNCTGTVNNLGTSTIREVN